MIKKILLFFSFFFILNISNVYAQGSEQCQGITRYVDYSDVYLSIYNNNDYRQFYTDFKDWFDSQSTYTDYMILRQIGANNTYYNRIFLYNNLSNLNPKYYHYLSNYGNYFKLFISSGVSSRVDIGYFNFSSDVFDSSLMTTCNLQQTGNSCMYNYNYSDFYGLYTSFENINNDVNLKKFTWVVDDSSNVYRNSFILIDSTFNLPISSVSGDRNYFTSFKLNDTYYCIDDNVPSVNDTYSLYYTPIIPIDESSLIYLPINDFTSYDTYIYLDNNTIRAIKDNTCTDYNLLNHYNKIISSCENFDYSNYVVIDQQNLTNDFLYRLDISSFIILLLFMFLIVVFIPWYVFSSFFRRRRF